MKIKKLNKDIIENIENIENKANYYYKLVIYIYNKIENKIIN